MRVLYNAKQQLKSKDFLTFSKKKIYAEDDDDDDDDDGDGLCSICRSRCDSEVTENLQ